jgi:hypothetical protein
VVTSVVRTVERCPLLSWHVVNAGRKSLSACKNSRSCKTKSMIKGDSGPRNFLVCSLGPHRFSSISRAAARSGCQKIAPVEPSWLPKQFPRENPKCLELPAPCYAAFNRQTGSVLGKTASRHTSAEFVAFLADRAVVK